MTLFDELHVRGPVTVATFMELALYHPELGYYARADQRSGRAGDFFTSVDVGPLFGELLEARLARGDQPGRRRVDARCGAASAPRLHRHHRLRTRGARSLLGLAFGGYPG